MARPVHVPISSGLAAWDGEVDDNFDLVFVTPLPLGEYADFASLPLASDFEDCIAVIVDEDVLCISDGTNWQRLGAGAPPQYANVGALPAASGATGQIAVIQDKDILVISDGTNWKLIGTQAADVVAFTGSPGGSATDTLALSLVTARTAPSAGTAGNHVNVPDPAAAPATATILRDDLVNNVLPVIRDSLKTIAEQLNEITDAGGLQLDARDNLQALTTKINLIRTNLRATDLMA